MVIDCHVHVLSAEDAHLSELLTAADAAGIDVLFVSSLGRRWEHQPSAERLEESAADTLAAVAKHPDRFAGMLYCSADHIGLSLELFERHVANGPLRFLKLWVSQLADDPRLDPLLDRAEAHGTPVMQHTWVKATGSLPHESTPHHVAALARRRPGLRIWLAHYGGRWQETGRIVADLPNVGIDLSGGDPEDGILEGLLRHVPSERIFFGSDAPGRSFIVQKAKVTYAHAPEAVKRGVLGDNVARWWRHD